jgi:hypothetical protein
LIGWGAIQHNHNWQSNSVIANNKAYGRTMATTITPTWQDVNRINYFTPPSRACRLVSVTLPR